MKHKIKSDYVKWGITTFVVGAALILFNLSAKNIVNPNELIIKTVDVLMPFIIGFVLAYLMTPLYNASVRRMRFYMNRRGLEDARTMRIAKPVSLAITFTVLIAVFALLLYLVIPELISTIADLVVTLPETFDRVIAWMQHKAEVYQIWGLIEEAFQNSNEKLLDWMTEKVLPASMSVMDGISTGVMGIIGALSDIVIGFIAAVYMLASKDIFAAQTKKMCCCLFSSENAAKIRKGADVINQIFMRFVSSNLIDGLIVGILTCIFMNIVRWEYAMLIAVIVGVTNLIPFFGPFIGAIPSIALLLTVNPLHALYFGLFVVVLQQIDGNIIKPKLFGEGVGLPSFWVMFAIIVGGGFFGFIGMLLAVPVFACIYQYAGYRMGLKLKKNQMSTDLDDYRDPSLYDMRETKFKGLMHKLQQMLKKKGNENNSGEEDIKETEKGNK